jgi:hypothetical protein
MGALVHTFKRGRSAKATTTASAASLKPTYYQRIALSRGVLFGVSPDLDSA